MLHLWIATSAFGLLAMTSLSSARSIAHFLEQLHDLPPPGSHVFYVLVDVLKLASQRFDHRRARRKMGRGFAEAGANFAQRKAQTLRIIDKTEDFYRRIRIRSIAIPVPDRLRKHLVLLIKANARGRDPCSSGKLPDAHGKFLDLKP